MRCNVIFSVMTASAILAAIALVGGIASAGAEDTYAWIAGARTGWWAGGDTLEFAGDGEVSPAIHCTVECIDWSCAIDYCYDFRKVTGVNVESCSYTSAEELHGCTVDRCFWLGSICPNTCWDCDHNYNYCGSLWRVLAFNAGVDDQGDYPPEPDFGCWSIQLLCEQDEPTSPCSGGIPEDWCDE